MCLNACQLTHPRAKRTDPTNNNPAVEWASEAEMTALLSDRAQLAAFVSSLAQDTLSVGQAAQKELVGRTFVLPCALCNTPYDAGQCSHPETAAKVHLPPGQMPALQRRVHALTLTPPPLPPRRLLAAVVTRRCLNVFKCVQNVFKCV